ncbi:MAG: glycosyl transferase family protein [Bacteroidetes bacterium]|nr:MAG: glycosyl transferase family protein [Bacteroidota bacterium]
MSYFLKIIDFAELVIFIYFALAAIYITIFGFASLLPQRKYKNKHQLKRKFAVLIPGYKEDNVIISVAADALEQDYPKELFDVIVIADSFKPSTLEALKSLPIKVVEVVFEVSKKSKALNKCMEVIGDNYDIAMILDADNIMEHDVLSKINEAFNQGFLAVQGHRMAKNTNTHFAVLDAVSEEINNKIFRKGHRVLGLSSALIGSGMGIDYALFKRTMATVDSVGEDKEVEIKLLKNGYTIEYIEDARIYDEKTSKKDVFVNQRRRWIAAQIEFFRRYFFDGLWHLIRYGNFDYFDKVLQMIQPPRILSLGILFLATALKLILDLSGYKSETSLIAFELWLLAFVLTIITLIITTPIKFYNKKTLLALFSLPHGFLLMFKSLLKVKGASKRFIHTTHEHIEKPIKRNKNNS